MTKAVDSGKPPLLDAMGASIPDSIVAAARADGLLLPGEVPIYAFIPADGTAADALLFTKSYIIRRSKSHPRRLNSEEANVDIKFNKSTGKAGAGVLIARVKGEKPDTIYKGLSGIEFMRLRTSLVTLPSDDK
jgi:hypothetical protein